MTEPVLPLSQEDLYNFISNGIAPSPQEVYAKMLTNFSDEAQSIINAPANPIGTLLLTASVAVSAILGWVVKLNSNLLFTDSQGDWLRKIIYNFGTKAIPSTSTVVREGFDIDISVDIAAGTIWLDENDTEFENITPFSVTAATGEINLYSVEKGIVSIRGLITPRTPIVQLSNFSLLTITAGREEETDEAIHTRLENAQGAKIFGTTTFLEAALLDQINYVFAAKSTQNNTNSSKLIQNIDVDSNSIVSIVRSLIPDDESVGAIGSTIFNSIKSAQKLSQPPILGGDTLPGVKYFEGYIDETALNTAGYEVNAASVWSVWTPNEESGVVNIPYINAQNQDIEITYNVQFTETITLEQRQSLFNQLKVISLEQTPIFSQTFSRLNVNQYYNVVNEAIDETVSLISVFLSVKGDAGQQDKQSIISDLDKYLNLDGEIIEGTAYTDDVIINEV